MFVDRPLNEWMTNNILAMKAIRRKNELIWRKTRITINFNIYYNNTYIYIAQYPANAACSTHLYI